MRVLNLVTQDSIEHRMLSLLAQKQALADGVLDGRGDLRSLHLPTGRAAFFERIEAVMGTAAGMPPRAAAATLAAPAAAASSPTPPVASGPALSATEPAVLSPAPATAAESRAAPLRLRDALLAGWSDRLLMLSLRGGPGGREAVVAVLDRVTGKDRGAIAALVERSFAEAGSAPPAVEIFDRSTFDAIERLVEAGVLQFTASGASLLDRSPAPALEEHDLERRRRLARARELCEQAERKSRMAALLAGGGFPVEALAPLREALETALRALYLAEAGEEQPQEAGAPAREVPADWLETNLARHAVIGPGVVELIADLRGRSAALLMAGEEEACAWRASGERAVGQIAQAVDREAG